MGNRESSHGDRRKASTKQEESSGIPHITVIAASPLPAQESMFNLPGPAQNETSAPPAAGCQHRTPEAESQENQFRLNAVTRRRNSKGSQHRLPGSPLGLDDGQNEGATSPKGSRVHFIEVMMHSSPQVRRSMVLRNYVYLSSRSEDSQSDSDSVSLVSSNMEEDRSPIALDPLEHDWMICASDGDWDSMHNLLSMEPDLVLRKDFVTGFTCLHWAAKQGNPELIALIVNFAKRQALPIDINVRSSNGYTPLHVATMHNNMEVVMLLVGTYSADVEMRDYSGKKACQYISMDMNVDIQDIIEAYELSKSQSVDSRDWRFSKVFQSNLKPLSLHVDVADDVERHRQNPVRRKSSLSRMKFQRIRARTSQIIHRMSF